MSKNSLSLLVVLTALVVGVAFSAPGEPPEFSPQHGFDGDSEGTGTLTFLLGKQRPFHVQSRGTAQPDGTFRLEQTIRFQGSEATSRVWILRTVGPSRYAATLSDAAGPVTGSSDGSLLRLEYRARGPLVMRQELRLMPDGKTIDNVGVISLLGMPVGRLKETIVRKGRALTSDGPATPMAASWGSPLGAPGR